MMVKRILTYIASLAVVLSTAACSGGSNATDAIRMSESSKRLEGRQYQDVVGALQKAGFTNVKANPLGDLITGWLSGEGEVKAVEVDGDSSFSTDDSFPSAAPIVVSYHSFPANNDKASKSASQSSGGSETLTAESSRELATLLAGPDVGDNVEAFSRQYRTKTIAFDGHVASISPSSVKRFKDILILAGNSGVSPSTGPNFQISGDPTYSGSNIPENIAVGQNVRVTALVGEYNSKQGLFHLVVTSIQIK